jgi:di/tricarboxylate transporter
VGDTLLLQGTWEALDERLADPEVLVVDSPELVRRQAVPLGAGAKRALGYSPAWCSRWPRASYRPAVAGLVAACAMVLLRVLTVEGAYRGINWTTVVLVAGMTPLSVAMTQTGAADLISERLIGIVGPLGPYALLAGLFVLTATFGQLISNMATALIVIPIALAAAGDLGLSVRPVLMSVTIAAAGGVPHPGRHAREHDGDGACRLQVRRLLEARPAAPRPVIRDCGLPRAARLAVLKCR